MNFKPRVFIASSTEGIDVVKIIEKKLVGFAEVDVWVNTFDFGKSNLENLLSQIALYDYAILVATADDLVLSRGNLYDSARDNVLFEFGLFSGGLGRDRVFYIIEENIKIPSDLNGISLPKIKSKKSKEFELSVTHCINQIMVSIEDKESTFDLGFLPSTALAYGYFVNFVEKTATRLFEDKKAKKIFHLENGVNFTFQDLKITILIPDDLSNNMFDKVRAKRLRDTWEKLKVDTKDDIRDYDFSIDVSKVENGLLHLVDIPLTLNALNKAIEMYSKIGHIGKDKKEKLLEQREIKNFKRVIEYLADKSSITNGVVNVEIVNI